MFFRSLLVVMLVFNAVCAKRSRLSLEAIRLATVCIESRVRRNPKDRVSGKQEKKFVSEKQIFDV
ncbi:MAG: hypothetical protein AB7F43_05720 [Bacteriovoracia bacterium]